MSDYLPVHKQGTAISCTAGAAITGGQVLIVNTDGTVSPSSSATASPKVVGIAGFDAAVGERVTVWAGGVQYPLAGSSVTAGQLVQSTTSGSVAPYDGLSEPTVLGLALTTATGGARVRVQFRR
jgi:hypothetical protein